MRLHSPAFEKNLRRGVRQAVRGSPALKREYWAAWRKNTSLPVNGIFRLWWASFVSLGIAGAAAKRGHLEIGLAFIGLWGLGFVFFRANQLLNCLFQAPEITSLVLLPVTEERIFNWGLWRFVCKTWPTFFDLGLCFLALAGYSHLSLGRWLLVPLFIVLAWLAVLALAILCAAYVPRKLAAMCLTGSMLCAVVFFISTFSDLPFLPFLESTCWPLSILLPTGWPAVLFSSLIEGWNWKYCGFIGLLAGVFWGVRPALARLRSHYEWVEVSPVEAPDLVPGQVSPAGAGTPPADGFHVGETEIAEIIETRRMFAFPAWQNRGWFESVLWRWLTPREHALCEFAFPVGLFITPVWRRIFRNLMVVFGGLLLAKWIFASLTVYGILCGVALLIPGVQALGQLYGHGRAFAVVFSSGYKLPRHACLGVGYTELSRLLFKCAAVQAPLFIGGTLGAGLMVAVVFVQPIPICAGIAFKMGVAIVISRVFFVVLAFSELSTDSFLRLRWRLWFYGGILIVALFLYIGTLLSMIFIPDPLWDFLLGLLAMAMAGVCWWLYGRLYQGHNFDLMKAPQ